MASRTLRPWRDRSTVDRVTLIRRWLALCMIHHDDLAQILTTEHRKSTAESRRESADGSVFLQSFSAEEQHAYGDAIQGATRDRRITVIKQLLGVVANIIPWNYSNAMITRKARVALAESCTIAAKSRLATAYSALGLAAFEQETGIPARPFNVLTGESENVDREFAANPTVRNFSRTGSTKVGELLMLPCPGAIGKLLIELGGNAPFTVSTMRTWSSQKRRLGNEVQQRRSDFPLCQPHLCANRRL